MIYHQANIMSLTAVLEEQTQSCTSACLCHSSCVNLNADSGITQADAGSICATLYKISKTWHLYVSFSFFGPIAECSVRPDCISVGGQSATLLYSLAMPRILYAEKQVKESPCCIYSTPKDDLI